MGGIKKHHLLADTLRPPSQKNTTVYYADDSNDGILVLIHDNIIRKIEMRKVI